MTKKLGELQGKYRIKISAFVLMNNHFHLLILTPEEDIDRVMYFFMKEVTCEIQKYTGRINKIFGGIYKGSMIDNYGHLVNVYKYIYRNPIEVGLLDKAEFYPYSTLFFKAHKSFRTPFKIENIFPPHAFDSFEDLDEVKWINQKFEPSEAASIRCGLQKTVFAYERDRNNGKPVEPIVRHPKKKTQEELWDDLLEEENLELRLLDFELEQ
jgi:putative transposase